MLKSKSLWAWILGLGLLAALFGYWGQRAGDVQEQQLAATSGDKYAGTPQPAIPTPNPRPQPHQAPAQPPQSWPHTSEPQKPAPVVRSPDVQARAQKLIADTSFKDDLNLKPNPYYGYGYGYGCSQDLNELRVRVAELSFAVEQVKRETARIREEIEALSRSRKMPDQRWYNDLPNEVQASPPKQIKVTPPVGRPEITTSPLKAPPLPAYYGASGYAGAYGHGYYGGPGFYLQSGYSNSPAPARHPPGCRCGCGR